MTGLGSVLFLVLDLTSNSYYLQTFTVISKSKDIFRFSATKSLWILDPFNPIRRVAIYMLVHPLFSFLVIVTILTNCILMTFPPEESIERTEYAISGCITLSAHHSFPP